ELAIHAARLAGDADGALAWATTGLRRFGIALPDRVGIADILALVVAWQSASAIGWLRRHFGRVRRLPGLARLANVAAGTVFHRRPELAFLVALKAAARARRAG